ncbi:UrcA family protein [Asticcacaulis sp.]|uniref:UrcA family protein n=1 Tax=Asticcacaulis sp. TaxID=1872648 RepID=UPI002C7FE442|nr:UrcA family protein [Asticcacaulis sp.]HTM82126.1 UrcA family protein [Asticcacaulis sp.]
MLRSVLGFALLSGLFAAPAVFAQEPGVSKVDITFKTRQLQDPAQAKAVYARLYKVVQYVCQTDGGEGPTWRIADDRACEDEAMQGALQQLNRPELMALYTPGAPERAYADSARRKH